jgi:hypothetical protein
VSFLIHQEVGRVVLRDPIHPEVPQTSSIFHSCKSIPTDWKKARVAEFNGAETAV